MWSWDINTILVASFWLLAIVFNSNTITPKPPYLSISNHQISLYLSASNPATCSLSTRPECRESRSLYKLLLVDQYQHKKTKKKTPKQHFISKLVESLHKVYHKMLDVQLKCTYIRNPAQQQGAAVTNRTRWVHELQPSLVTTDLILQYRLLVEQLCRHNVQNNPHIYNTWLQHVSLIHLVFSCFQKF